MHSTHDAQLQLPVLPDSAQTAHIVPALHTKSLISLGQLCDAGCDITLTAATISVQLDDQTVLTGNRNPHTKLWELPITSQPSSIAIDDNNNLPNSAHAAVSLNTPANLVQFAHAALFSPVLSTLEKALARNFLPDFPGLTSATLRKYPPHSEATSKGHMNQIRKYLRPTIKEPTALRVPPTLTATTEADDAFPLPITPADKSHACYAGVVEPFGRTYSDQTGRFIQPSSVGNYYLFVFYDYDSNCIFAEPLPNRTAPVILRAFIKIHTTLCKAGFKPLLHRMDNECDQSLKSFMADNGMEYQLTPPHVHRRNAAERAIQTFKNHFIAGLCSTDPTFPIHLWDRLLPQALLTLNLMRASRSNPNLSAHMQVYGPFSYNRTPIAPPGTKVLVHDKPTQRKSWAVHALDAWYLGPALDSYRCYRVWIWDTQSERISDTLEWFPQHVRMPTTTSTDLLLAGLRDVTHALNSPTANSPLAPLTDSHASELRRAVTLLSGAIDKCTPLPPSVSHAPTLRVEPQVLTHAPVLRVSQTPTIHAALPAPTVRFASDVPLTTNTTTQKFSSHQTPAIRKKSERVTGPQHRPRHNHGTRANSHVTLAATVTLSPPTTLTDDTAVQHVALHGNALNPDTGLVAKYPELIRSSSGAKWIKSNDDEIHRLAQGHNEIHGTNTIFFVPRSVLPENCKPAYITVVCAYRPEKEVAERIRWCVGGDKIEYSGDVSTKTAALETAKLLINSVISTPNGKMLCADLKDFYLGNNLPTYEYIRIPVGMLSQHIIDHYNLLPLIHNGFVYAEVRKGMYGLPIAGKLANDELIRRLAPFGYHPVPYTHGLWKDDHSDLVFTLVVDDFGIRYTQRNDAQRLLDTLRAVEYRVSEDWAATQYVGITLHWDYTNRTVDLSMPGYIDRALSRFQHPHPAKPAHSPFPCADPNYGARTQWAEDDDLSAALDAKQTNLIQQIIGVLLYYARAIDATILPALGSLGADQSKPTTHTMDTIIQLLNYCATHSNAVLRYTASDMVLWIDSDASYLSVSKARSRAAGYYFLSSNPDTLPDPTAAPSNGAITVYCQILKTVVSSAAEAELGALFLNSQNACPLRVALEEMGHPQPATPIQTDNSTACGIINDTVKQKRSKSMDMRFYWIRDRVRQGQFRIYWKAGSGNLADYFSKHHPIAHHQSMRSKYLHISPNYYAALDDQHVPSQSLHSGEGVLIPRGPGGSPVPSVSGISD